MKFLPGNVTPCRGNAALREHRPTFVLTGKRINAQGRGWGCPSAQVQAGGCSLLPQIAQICCSGLTARTGVAGCARPGQGSPTEQGQEVQVVLDKLMIPQPQNARMMGTQSAWHTGSTAEKGSVHLQHCFSLKDQHRPGRCIK